MAPLLKFPSSISTEDQKRFVQEMNSAVAHDVIPTYRAFATFLETQYIHKSRTEAGVWSIPDGDAYYSFCIKRNTTLDMTADEIHQVGLDEVKRDEA